MESEAPSIPHFHQETLVPAERVTIHLKLSTGPNIEDRTYSVRVACDDSRRDIATWVAPLVSPQDIRQRLTEALELAEQWLWHHQPPF